MKNGAVLPAGAVACLLLLLLFACPRLVGEDKKPDVKKPEEVKKPEKKPPLVGTVKALSDDGQSFTLQPAPTKKNEKPPAIDIRLGKGAKITTGKGPAKLAVGQVVTEWLLLDGGEKNVTAAAVQVGKPVDNKTVKKPGAPAEDNKKPTRNPRAPSKPPRDPAPTAAVIDAELDKQLSRDKIPPSPRAMIGISCSSS